MMTGKEATSGGSPGFDAATLVVLGGGVVTIAVWAGAELATLATRRHVLRVSLADALAAAVKLPARLGVPREAWPEVIRPDVPGPIPYWIATVLAIGVVGALAFMISKPFRSKDVGTRRTRVGVDTRVRFATTRDLKPLVVSGPVDGRLILGQVGRQLVATEDRSQQPMARRHARAGDRSSVCVIGPSRCGKTANIITGILEWNGPAILSSVKSDVLEATLDARRELGDVRIFDPTGGTGHTTARWSPLRDAGNVTGAQKAARALVDAAPREGVDNIGFFQAMAKQLLWPCLYAAAISERTMQDVVHWILTQDRLLEEDTGAVLDALDRHLVCDDEARRAEARLALEAVTAIWELDERTRGSAFATCQTMIEPWLDPTVAAAAKGCDVDLEWLVSGRNTLYICAPTHEQQRLSPVFGGLMGDLIQQAYEKTSRTNQPLPSTLLVMDEAGNTPTRWLPPVASTCAAIGILLVTIWQSRSQIDAAYGSLADSVLTNHGTKIIFSGASDLATLGYASELLGTEEVAETTRQTDSNGRSVTSSGVARLPLLPPDLLRRTKPGEALLIHGTLQPAHLRARPYYRQRVSRAHHTGSQPAD